MRKINDSPVTMSQAEEIEGSPKCFNKENPLCKSSLSLHNLPFAIHVNVGIFYLHLLTNQI